LPLTKVVEEKNKNICIIHDLSKLDIEPKSANYHVLISGHSHRPKVENRNGIIYLNPGSAGPRRFKLPVCVAMMEIEGDEINVRLIELI